MQPRNKKWIRSVALSLTVSFMASAGAVESGMAEAATKSTPTIDGRQVRLKTPLPPEAALNKDDNEEVAQSVSDGSESALAIGDRLKISVFMSYGSANGVDTDNQGALPTLVEQPDLSGEYVVQGNGQLFLPLAGPIQVLGVSLPEATHAIEKAFRQKQDGQIRVGIQLSDREPVYITGNIPTPATVKYTPGLTVLQAAIMAGAGQSLSQPDQRLSQLELVRENERVQQSTERLAKALARRAVLIAERDGKDPTIPSALSTLASKDTATALLSEAEQLRGSDLSKIKEQSAALDESLDAMQNELTLLRDTVSHTEDWIKDLKSRVQTLDPMFKRGSISSATMYGARTDLETAQQREQDTKAKIAHLEQDITSTTASKSQLATDVIFERQKALDEVEDEIQQDEITRGTMGRYLMGASKAVSVDPVSITPQYKILRQSLDGRKELAADGSTELLPGDILEILAPTKTRKWSYVGPAVWTGQPGAAKLE
jgi:exopolysaccharide production protein ExoF